MYKLYFKQAWGMLKQNKFISIVSIAGTALAIMMVMVIITAEVVKDISVAPEVNRDKTLYLKFFTKKPKNVEEKGMWQSTLPYDIYKNYLSDLKTPELTSAIVDLPRDDRGKMKVKKNDNNEYVDGTVKPVDNAYWKIMSFTFTEGRPFSNEDFADGIKNAVITNRFAKEIFGNENPVGKNVEIGFAWYKVVGIVKDVSQIFEYGYGDVYVPYTSLAGYDKRPYHLLFLMNNTRKDFEALSDEFKLAERKFDAVDPEWNLTLEGPYNHKLNRLKQSVNHVPDTNKSNMQLAVTFLVLLLVPAVNLSGFSLSRIKRRMGEIGVRKAFGAQKHVILVQVLYENFITSFIGGIIGLVFSYILVVWLKSWLLGIDTGSAVPVSALVSVPVFVSMFIACVLLNLLSAGIPAYRASRITIINALNQNKV